MPLSFRAHMLRYLRTLRAQYGADDTVYQVEIHDYFTTLWEG